MTTDKSKHSKPISNDLLRYESDDPPLYKSLLIESPPSLFTTTNNNDTDSNHDITDNKSINKIQEFKTFKLPESTLLSRLDQFIPQLQHSNHELFNHIQHAGTNKQYAIDNTSSDDSDQEDKQIQQHIEMDLMLGVLEAQKSDDHDSTIKLTTNHTNNNNNDNQSKIQQVDSIEDTELPTTNRPHKRSKTPL